MKQYLRYKKWYKAIKESELFDVKYYIFTYPDIRKIGVDPIKHYIKHGAMEGRNPSEYFDTKFYLDMNPDIRKIGINPLAHYILYGQQEQRQIRPVKSMKIQTTAEDNKISKPIVLTKKNPQKETSKRFLKNDEYKLWLDVNGLSKNRIKYLKDNLQQVKHEIKFSIIMPVYNPPLKFLEKAIESIENQFYTNWEICVVDDASTNTFVKPFLENLAKNYNNIRINFNQKNRHISESTNIAVNMANGDYLVFLDQDDELEKDALAELALYIHKNKDSEIIYSDDDKIDTEGNRFAPQFKPDFSPEYLLSFMYCGHIKCVKKSLYTQVGGFRKGYEGSQDYDFFLRATERAKHVGHIPRVLYHWRVVPGSTAAGGNEKNYSFEAGRKAVEDSLKRRNVIGRVYQPDWAFKNGNGIYAIDFPDNGKSVGIIIPTKNGYDLLKRCVESLKKTTYKNYQVYIIDNESDDPKTIKYLDSLKECEILKIKSPQGKFNFAYINNEAVKSVKEELLLFLNNDTEVINPKWLSQMVGYMQFNGVGSVGARLLFPDNRIQHAGILHNISHGFPMTSGRLLADWEWGYMASTVTSKNFLAMTAACMLTPKKLFKELNGFDEKNFAVAFNDCDYGYRVYKAGYRNVLAPEAKLYHYEGATRGHGDKPVEESNYIRKYGNWSDPYYNQNLALNCSDYSIASKTVVSHKIPKFRLLMVTHSLNLEGAPKSFFELAKTLKKHGDIEPVVVSHTTGALAELYQEEGIDIHIVKGFNLFQLDTNQKVEEFLKRQRDLIKSLNVDVVYGNTIETCWAMRCAKLLNLPSVWNIRESEEPFSSHNHNPKIKNRMIQAMAYPYKVVFVADATKKVYERLNSQNNFLTIYNGFDKERAEEKTKDLSSAQARELLGIDKKETVLLALGTVCERKGQIDLIQAIEKLDYKDIENVKVYIVGDRKSLPYSQRMHEIIEKLPSNKKEKIVIVDETMDIYKYYMASDIFVCSSRVESFPKVIQEAMYYELAIITTPVFGIVEQVKDNVSALYYPPGNIEKLTKNIKRLLGDNELKVKIAKNAKIALDVLPTIQEMSLAYEEVFKEAWLSGESR